MEKQLEVIHGEFSQSKDSATNETVNSILANLKVEIENVYVRFEDEDLKFAIGFLLPKTSCISTDPDFNPKEGNSDTSVLYKKLTIDDLSVFINNKSTFVPMS